MFGCNAVFRTASAGAAMALRLPCHRNTRHHERALARAASSFAASPRLVANAVRSSTHRAPHRSPIRAAWASTSSSDGGSGVGDDEEDEDEADLVIKSDDELQSYWTSLERRAIRKRKPREPGTKGRVGMEGKLHEMDVRLAAGDPSVKPDPRSVKPADAADPTTDK